jgi:hypothetical protein
MDKLEAARLSLTPMRFAGQARSIMNRGFTATHYYLIIANSFISSKTFILSFFYIVSISNYEIDVNQEK